MFTKKPPEFTACIDCKHLLNTGKDGRQRDIWYNHYCKASPLPTARDPYDGREKRCSKNSLGAPCFVREDYQYCRDVNTNGNCPKFERAAMHLKLLRGRN